MVAPVITQVRAVTVQLSVVTGFGVVTEAEQLPGVLPVTILAGQDIDGGCVSLTVIVKLQLAVPQLFVAVTVTVVTPALKVEPLPVPLPLPVVAPVNE